MADFVGTNNLVPGVVESRRDGRLIVETPLGRLQAVPSGAVTERCVLAIRPENVALADGRGGEDNVVRGRVAFVSYLGNTLRYDLEAGNGHVLKVDVRDAWHHEPLPVGREVAATFPASVTLAVSDDT